MTTTFKIIRYCDDPTKIFDLLEKMSREEESDLIFSLKDIISPDIYEDSEVNTYSDSWKAITLKVYCSKTTKDLIPDLDFNILYKKLKEKYDVNNLRDFLSRILKLPSSFEFDSNVSPRIYIYAPIYAKIYRFDLDNNEVKIYVKACKALKRHNISLFLKVIDKQDFIFLKNVCFNRANKLADISEYFSIFVYEYDVNVDNLKEIRVELRDSSNEEFEHVGLNVEKLVEVKQKTKISFYERLKKLKKTVSNTVSNEIMPILSAFLLFVALIISIYYLIILIYYYFNNENLNNNTITAIATLLTAIATLWTVRVTQRQVRLSESEIWRPVAEEVLKKMEDLESKIKSIKSSVECDMFVDYSGIFKLVKYLELKPYLRVIVYDKCPTLRLVLSELIRSLIDYNVNIEREKAQKALKCIDNALKKINKLKTILHKEYGVTLNKPKNNYLQL